MRFAVVGHVLIVVLRNVLGDDDSDILPNQLVSEPPKLLLGRLVEHQDGAVEVNLNKRDGAEFRNKGVSFDDFLRLSVARRVAHVGDEVACLKGIFVR